MEIFVGNLPERATAVDLHRVFLPVAEANGKRFLFWRRHSLEYLNFRIIERQSAAGKVRYGWGIIEPDWLARICMEQLNLRFLNGQPVVVREYYRRSYMNERRALDWRTRPWNGVERRNNMRRQYLLTAPTEGVPAAPAA